VLIGDADDWTIPGRASRWSKPCAAAARTRASCSIRSLPLLDVIGQPRAYLAEVGNRNKPNECCGATVAFDAGAFADARRRVAESSAII